MNNTSFLIGSQSQAEKDDYLFDCFHDSGFLAEIINSDYSILAGRKGTGKTAIARFLEDKYTAYDLLLSKRISITAFSDARNDNNEESVREKILVFILLTTAKELYEKGYLLKDSKSFWKRVFTSFGLGKTSTYESFRTKSKTNSLGSDVKILAGQLKEELEETELTINSETLFAALVDSLEEIGKQTAYLFFIDDLSDYLDNLSKEDMKLDIHIIKEVLIKLDAYNVHIKDEQKSLRFVACLRDDIFEFMEGSNINKLKTNALFLRWNEESFAGLIIRRLPHFSADLASALAKPMESIKLVFPDEIFADKLSQFETKRYATNFYAYMVAISFNRPRDFLAFCYASRLRLSMRRPATSENIDSAETEYSDYFKGEIRDELYLASKILDFDSDEHFLNRVIDVLAERDSFNANQIRTSLSPLLKAKTSVGRKRIERFVFQMWSYGILGFKSEQEEKIINFKYVNATRGLIQDKIDKTIFYLHRGLYWFAQKRKKD
jgi:hypothetical protein